MTTDGAAVSSFPPFFGVRRELAFPTLERFDFAARDGAALCLHHTSGGERGPIIMTPGTAMTALTYCIDSVPQNIVEYLVAQGFRGRQAGPAQRGIQARDRTDEHRRGHRRPQQRGGDEHAPGMH